jgi:hypothetical protein
MTCTDITHPHAKTDDQHLAAEPLLAIAGMLPLLGHDRNGRDQPRHRVQGERDPTGSGLQAQVSRPERTSCPVLKLRSKRKSDLNAPNARYSLGRRQSSSGPQARLSSRMVAIALSYRSYDWPLRAQWSSTILPLALRASLRLSCQAIRRLRNLCLFVMRCSLL